MKSKVCGRLWSDTRAAWARWGAAASPLVAMEATTSVINCEGRLTMAAAPMRSAGCVGALGLVERMLGTGLATVVGSRDG